MSFLYEEDTQRAEELGTAWYRSKEVFPQDIPYAGYLTNKKWPLNEVMSLHLIMLQQARNSVILCYDLDILSPCRLDLSETRPNSQRMYQRRPWTLLGWSIFIFVNKSLVKC